jgi:hypothetical protein
MGLIRYRVLGLVVALLFPLATMGSEKEDLKLVTLVSIASQPDSPIQILGFKMPTKAAGHPSVVFRNISQKEIRGVVIVGVEGDPSDPGALRGEKEGKLLASDPVEQQLIVAPSNIGEYKDRFPRSTDFVSDSIKVHSNCLHAAVLVYLVVFSDGSKWDSSDWDTMARLWRNSVTPESASSCDHSHQAEQALQRLRGSRYRATRSPSRSDTAILPKLSLSCLLEKDQEFADCPI